MIKQSGIQFRGKKAIALFSTIILVFIFSLLAVKIYEIKSINSINIINQYKYIQAKNHLMFLEEYVKSLDELLFTEKIQIENEKFEIIGKINKEEENKYKANLSVNAIGFNVRVYKSIEIIK